MLILITPQLFDLINFNSSKYYRNFFKLIGKKFNVLDLSPIFIKKINQKKFYTNDKYGGHLSFNGNKAVSKLLYKYLKKRKLL